LLSAIYRTGQTYGIGHIVDVVTGKPTARIEQLGHNTLPTYGVGKDLTAQEWKSIARQLMARGFINADMEFGSLIITDDGVQLLKGKTQFRYRPDVKIAARVGRRSSSNKKDFVELPDEAQGLFIALKGLRKEIAAERSVPAYVVFSDKSLVDMATMRPETLDQFGYVHGVGASKKDEFGPRFVQFISDNLP